MTPLEKAVEAYDNATLGTAEAHVRRIITAFLEAAAEDTSTVCAVYRAIDDNLHMTFGSERAGLDLGGSPKAAILALKEAVG